ncbi:protein sprouty [Onthophagus taurus]|uniref:protein sprouty n=1 Tax=Onthophagus taurus TaxID=166361 RepID=UPI000C20B4D1|nr:protein sprouty [Onthophagus taurus]XP_022903933.1 protein sprouty [Onthophagus taurus]
MAHHGGPETLPRAHRARAPAVSVATPATTTTTTPLAPFQQQQRPNQVGGGPTTTVVTLQTPRPESDRKGNEYVDNPLPFLPATHHQHQTNQNFHHHQLHQNHQIQQQNNNSRRPPHLHLSDATSRRPPPPPVPTISKQPTRSFRKEVVGQSELHLQQHQQQQQQQPVCASRRSIMCDECGRCRCFDCQQPPRLPICWLCNNHCLCSADAAVDYASCLCCVKGVYYHCSDSDSGGDSTCADDPCGCGPERRAARWGCLAVLSVVLPCLWLYWPLQGCKSAVENCYSRYTKQGCRCRPPLNTPEKRLLDSSPDF